MPEELPQEKKSTLFKSIPIPTAVIVIIVALLVALITAYWILVVNKQNTGFLPIAKEASPSAQPATSSAKLATPSSQPSTPSAEKESKKDLVYTYSRHKYTLKYPTNIRFYEEKPELKSPGRKHTVLFTNEDLSNEPVPYSGILKSTSLGLVIESSEDINSYYNVNKVSTPEGLINAIYKKNKDGDPSLEIEGSSKISKLTKTQIGGKLAYQFDMVPLYEPQTLNYIYVGANGGSGWKKGETIKVILFERNGIFYEIVYRSSKTASSILSTFKLLN